MQLPKMRTATGVVDELRAVDPNTAVSVHLVRRLINSGAVPSVPSGNRKLVSVDAVCEYLASGQAAAVPRAGKIRRVNERGF